MTQTQIASSASNTYGIAAMPEVYNLGHTLDTDPRPRRIGGFANDVDRYRPTFVKPPPNHSIG